MKTLTYEQVEKEIKRRNRLFEKADAVGKRVLIAKEVIKTIKDSRFSAQGGTFITVHDHRLGVGDRADSVQELFLRGEIPDCAGCAQGALLLACTLWNNKDTYADTLNDGPWSDAPVLGQMIRDRKQIKNGLNTFFSREQLILIEQAFEWGDGFFGKSYRSSNSNAAILFGKKIDDPEGRLLAIMRNIVRNKGTFKP